MLDSLHGSRELHLSQAARNTAANHDVLVKLFERIGTFFERLKVYTNVPSSPAVTDGLAKIMAEVLSILALATKGIREGRTSETTSGMNYASLTFDQKYF